MNWTSHFAASFVDGDSNRKKDILQRGRVGMPSRERSTKASEKAPPISQDIKALAAAYKIGSKYGNGDKSLSTVSQTQTNNNINRRPPPRFVNVRDPQNDMLDDSIEDNDLTTVRQLSSSSLFSSQPMFQEPLGVSFFSSHSQVDRSCRPPLSPVDEVCNLDYSPTSDWNFNTTAKTDQEVRTAKNQFFNRSRDDLYNSEHNPANLLHDNRRVFPRGSAPRDSGPYTSSDGLSESSSDGYITEAVSLSKSQPTRTKENGFAAAFDKFLAGKLPPSRAVVSSQRPWVGSCSGVRSVSGDSVLDEVVALRPIADASDVELDLDRGCADVFPMSSCSINKAYSSITGSAANTGQTISVARKPFSSFINSAQQLLCYRPETLTQGVGMPNTVHTGSHFRSDVLTSMPKSSSLLTNFHQSSETVRPVSSATVCEVAQQNHLLNDVEPNQRTPAANSIFSDFFNSLNSTNVRQPFRDTFAAQTLNSSNEKTSSTKKASSSILQTVVELSSAEEDNENDILPALPKYIDCSVQTEKTFATDVDDSFVFMPLNFVPPHPAVVCILDEILSVVSAMSEV